jgi:hypothetical protein
MSGATSISSSESPAAKFSIPVRRSPCGRKGKLPVDDFDWVSSSGSLLATLYSRPTLRASSPECSCRDITTGNKSSVFNSVYSSPVWLEYLSTLKKSAGNDSSLNAHCTLILARISHQAAQDTDKTLVF